jgi:ribokinase
MLIVFGSINMDLNLRVKQFPTAGETVLSSNYTMSPGGKGANQAMAAARIGAKTALVGKVGDDGNGLRIVNNLKRNGVMTSGVAKSEDYPTGMAMVFREKSGENRIIVASGANLTVSAEQAPPDILHKDNVLLVQMELPLEQNAIVMKRAKENGAPVIMNLAPALAIPKELTSLIDYLIVNQIEARQIAKKFGMEPEKDTGELTRKLAMDGKMTVIVTMGENGVVASDRAGKTTKLKSYKPSRVVDTTGAGDCFCGTFAGCLHEGKSFQEALKISTVASGLSCEQEGTMSSYPYLEGIEEALKIYEAG